MIRPVLALMLAALPAMPATAQTAPPASPSPATGAVVGPALFVSDPARSLAFYVDGLGMKVGMEMGPPTRRETILKFGGDPSGAGIVLLFDGSGAATIEHGHGYARTILRMADLDAVEARLKAGGFATTPIRQVAMGYRMMMVTDPDGYQYEMIQAAPRR